MKRFSSRSWRFLMLGVAAAGAIVGMARISDAAGPAPDYSSFTQSYHIPYTKALNFDKLEGIHIRVSLDGGPPTILQVDTGSVGVIISADEVPHIDPHAPAGQMIYSSSGNELDGVWTPVKITFLDSKDAQGNQATAMIPVLAASEFRSSGIGVNAGKPKLPTKNPKVHMFGVGFGRGKEAHPERNPFVNLAEMQAGTMRRGYTITREGFTLGLTGSGVGTGYVFQQLKERVVSPEILAKNPGLKEWQSSRGSITVGGEHQPEMPVLIDTGLTNMMIPSANVKTYTDVPEGTPITVDLLGGKLHYNFNVGAKNNPVVPRKVTFFPALPTSNLNTGLRALAAFDYLYDADGGYLGLRPIAK
jgi:hypothetical protein